MKYSDDYINKVIQGNCLEVMKDIPDGSVDLMLTDPPYGYSFMGKSWDKALPDIDIFKECLRVLKAGAFALVMSAPRSDVQSRMALLLENAGFKIDFTPLFWAYASGFPKASNIGKMIDKRMGVEREVVGVSNTCTGLSQTEQTTKIYTQRKYSGKGVEDGKIQITAPATDQAKALDGSYGGYQPKPAVEVILVAMKPLSEKTYVDQALKNRKGITWLDDLRVPYDMDNESNLRLNAKNHKGHGHTFGDESKNNIRSKDDLPDMGFHNSKGRFPANLIVSDGVLDGGKIQYSKKAMRGVQSIGYSSGIEYEKAGEETNTERGHNDAGSFSRYFDLDKWYSKLPFLITPKAAKSEKNFVDGELEKKQTTGGGGMNDPHLGSAYGSIKAEAQNHHPTVKPVPLMSYLIMLGSREDDIVLDPFAGSCTTGVAAHQLDRKWIMIEKEKEYVEIGKARIRATTKQNKLF